MKLFKKTALTLGMIPFLASCGTNSIAGTYGFQMGKENGTHFGLFLKLTDETYKPTTPSEGSETTYDFEGYKKMTFSFNVSFPSGDAGSDQSEQAIADSSILDIFKDKDGNFSLSGYYKLLPEEVIKGETRLAVGLDFAYILSKVAEIYEKEMGEKMDDDLKSILDTLDNPDLIQSIVFTTYKDNTVNGYVPVSIDDAYYQLYWYGYDIQIKVNDPELKQIISMRRSTPKRDPEPTTDPDTDPDTDPGTDPEPEPAEAPFEINIVQNKDWQKAHIGAHPTADEIASMAEEFKETHADFVFTELRDFYQLKLGLIKR